MREEAREAVGPDGGAHKCGWERELCGMCNKARAMQSLVELLRVTLEGAEAHPVGGGAFGRDGGAAHLVEGADALLGGGVWSSDGGFESVKNGAPAFEGDAVKGGHGADGAEASFVLLGDERDGNPRELCGDTPESSMHSQRVQKTASALSQKEPVMAYVEAVDGGRGGGGGAKFGQERWLTLRGAAMMSGAVAWGLAGNSRGRR